MTLDELAMAAYTAYEDFLDEDHIAWIDLASDHRDAWKAAASRVADLLRVED